MRSWRFLLMNIWGTKAIGGAEMQVIKTICPPSITARGYSCKHGMLALSIMIHNHALPTY